MKRHNRQALFIESLETRALLAGNVIATVDESGKLFITGDNLDNRIEIKQLPPLNPSGPWQGARYQISNPWVPSGETPTTINGQASVIVEGVKTGMSASMLGGRDHVLIYRPNAARATVPGEVFIGMGEGNDGMILYLENRSHVDLGLGTGNDSVRFKGVVFDLDVLGDPHPACEIPAGGNDQVDLLLIAGGTVNIDTEYGNDAVRGYLETPNTSATATITTGLGDDGIALQHEFVTSTYGGSMRIDTGAGNDQATVTDFAISKSLTVNTDGGFDLVVVNRVTLGQSLTVWLGQQDDTLEIAENVHSPTTFLGGGDGTDTLDIHPDSGNDLGDATITGFESF